MKLRVVRSIFAALAFTATAIAGASEWQPSGPIRLEVGFAPGGSADTVARIIAQQIEKQQGWTVVVDNKPGGGGAVMASSLVNRPADGQTIGLAVAEALVTALASRSNSPFGVEDFDYLGTAAVAPLAMVAKGDAPFDDVASFLEYAKQKGSAVVAVPSRGHVLILRNIAKEAGAPVRALPTKGGAEALQNVLGGHVDAAFDGGAHVAYLSEGELKVIASITRTRHPVAKDQETLVEQGYNYFMEPYFFFAAPKGLPDNVKTSLAEAVAGAVDSEAVKEILHNRMNIPPVNLGPNGTAEMMTQMYESMSELVKSSQ